MGKRNPESKSMAHVAVDEDVHARMRVLSAQKNVTMKHLVKEMLDAYEAQASNKEMGSNG